MHVATAPSIAAVPAMAAANPGDPKEPFYGSRWERSYAVSATDADRLEALISKRVPPETRYPNPQRIQTVYVRSIDPLGPDEKFRIRSYPDSPGPPTLLEFKDTVIKDGQKITEKTRIPVAANTAQRLLWGEPGADVIGREGRNDADLAIANRAIDVVDKVNLRPVARQEYRRATYEDAEAGVRITFDRDIRFTGIGELARAGSGVRDHAIMDVKVIKKTPEWLSSLVDAETGAKHIRLLKDGKGATAVKELSRRLAPGQLEAA